MSSDSIIKRELLTSQFINRDRKLEYNFLQCQRQCSENSGFSKFSDDFYQDSQDSKTLQQFENNNNNNVMRLDAASKQVSFRLLRNGSSKQLQKLMADKTPSSKKQSAFSKRKMFTSNNSHYSLRNVQSPQKEKGIIHVIKRYWLAKRFINNMLKHSYVLSSALKMKLDEDLYDFTKSESQQQEYLNQNITNSYLMPASKFIRFWDFLTIFISLFSFWIVMFMFSFDWQVLSIEAAIFFFIIIDCLIDSRKAVIVQGEIIVSQPLIFQRYRKKQALEDFIYIIGWISLIVRFNNYFLVNEIVCVVLVVISLKKLHSKYTNYINSLYLTGETNSAIYDLLTLILSIITFAHGMACIWHYVGLQTLQCEKSWLITYELVNQSILIKYNYSFYWATMTMVTVGYGDITAQNQWEMLVANILMLCSTCMFAYSMNSIGIIVKNLYDTKQKFKRSLIQINTYMNKHNVNQVIQEKIRNYIKFQLQKQFDENQEELDQILSSLPADMIDELNSDIQSQIISKIHILKSFSQQTQNKFAQKLKSQQLPPNDSIYLKFDLNTNLYYVQEGKVEIFQEQTGKVIFTLQKGESFGFHSFFTGQPTQFSIRTVGFASIYKLARSDALNIVQITAKDWELFHHIKDNMAFNDDYSALNLICKVCNNYGHLTDKCPKINYQPNLESVYKKMYIDDENQDREGGFIRQNEKINSLKLQGLIQTTINQFVEMKQDEIEELNLSNQNHSPLLDSPQEFFKFKPSYEDKKAEFLQSDQQSSRMLRRAGSKQQRNSIQRQMGSNMNNVPTKELPSLGIILESNMAVTPSKLNPSQIHFDQKSQLDIDRVKNYTDYMPQNNISMIVGIYNSLVQKHIPTETLIEISKYTFNYKAVSLIAGIKQKLMGRKTPTPSASIIVNNNNNKNKQLPKI